MNPMSSVTTVRRRLPGPLSVAVLFLAYALVLFHHTSFSAGGSDSSGYVNGARLLAHGRAHEPIRGLARLGLSSDFAAVFTPLGYTAARQPGAMVPSYPPGFPLHMALASLLAGWNSGPFLVSPIAGLACLALLYLLGRELDVDAVCDGETVVIPGILEHIERAGIHSGDSFAVYPPITLTPAETDRVVEATTVIARLLKAVGLINIQFVIQDGIPHVLEVNPRASRTVPFLSKVTGVPMVNLATHAALGRSLTEFGFAGGLQASRPLYAVKAPVFSMAKLPAVDAVLGPEMKSTGEAMGIAQDLPTAQYKAFLSTMQELPPDGAALCSIADADKEEALPILRALHGLGIRLYATAGTAAFLSESAIPATTVQKLRDGHPNVVDVIRSGQVQLVVNTVSSSAPLARNGGVAPLRDGYEIRRASVERRIPCLTSLDTARALVQAHRAWRREHRSSVATLGEYVGALSAEVVRA